MAPAADLPRLRPLRRDDSASVLEAFRSHPDMRLQGDISSEGTARTYVWHLCHSEGPHRPFAIVAAGHMMGLVAVTVDARNRTGWFWYWMHKDFRGRGWTSRAAASVANLALAWGNLERLELAHRANNPVSASVARAAGFILEGTERQKALVGDVRLDVLTYGRLCSDPVPTTPELPWQRT